MTMSTSAVQPDSILLAVLVFRIIEELENHLEALSLKISDPQDFNFSVYFHG